MRTDPGDAPSESSGGEDAPKPEASVAVAKFEAFLAWLDSPLGRVMLDREREALESAARRFHGDALLWAGPESSLVTATERSMVRFRFAVAQPVGARASGAWNANDGSEVSVAQADLGELPLRTGSVAAVVLHHALDLADEPRHVLREVVRVLADGGRLVVCGFNPYSLWGLRRAYAGMRQDAFSDLRFVAPNRLHDWLTVLGMESPRLAPTLMHRPPLSLGRYEGPRWNAARQQLNRFPTGGCYVMTAVKQATAGHRHWRAELSRRLSATGAAPRPVVRQFVPRSIQDL